MRQLFIGIFLGFLLCGCAGFAYRYYGIEMPSQCFDKGKLIATEPKYDIPFSECKPDDFKKGKCVVMKTEEFYSFKGDYERCKIELKDCQKNCK